jgi:transposase
MILFEKFGQHQPLNRQAERYGREGVDLSLSTLADQVGICCAVLKPLFERLEAHVFAAGRLHADETTVPVLAKGKTHTGYLWTYVRDDQPFGGKDPPAAVYYYSRDRGGEHPAEHLAGYRGILQVDAYSGYNALFDGRQPVTLTPAFCWAHARRSFFKLADVEAAARRKANGKDVVIVPLALEAVKRIDALFAIERDINGRSTAERAAVRQERAAPLVAELDVWMMENRPQLSRHAEVARAMTYMLKRWDGFAGFLKDGRICLTNNAAERALRGIAIGRKAWLFCGSDRGGRCAATMYSLITTAKMNDVDPQAWLADVLARMADHPAHRLDQLLPWNWRPTNAALRQAA